MTGNLGTPLFPASLGCCELVQMWLLKYISFFVIKKKKLHLIKNVDIVPGHPARESGYKLNIKSLMVHKEISISAYVYTGYK